MRTLMYTSVGYFSLAVVAFYFGLRGGLVFPVALACIIYAVSFTVIGVLNIRLGAEKL
jgi:hypothetical protein